MRNVGISLFISLLLFGVAPAESPGEPKTLREVNGKEVARNIARLPQPWNLKACRKIRDLVTQYQVVEAAPSLKARLPRLARKDPGSALVILQAIAQSEGHTLGEDEGIVYLNLLPRLQTVDEWRAAWTLLLMLDTREYDQTVYRECTRCLDSFQRRAAPQATALQAYLDGEALQILSATTEMRETLDLARQPRISKEIEIYLDAGTAYPQYMIPWSAQRLIREARGGEPELQSDASACHPDRAAEVLQELQRYLSRLPLNNTRIEEEEERRLQLLRAIEFFGGELTAWQRGYLRANPQHNPRTPLWRGFLTEGQSS